MISKLTFHYNYKVMEHCKHPLSDFTTIRKLGKGSFGTAYLVRRNSDDLAVCLKEIPLRREVSQQEIEREAKALSDITDKHIIRYYGSFVENGHFYIIMEYAGEGSLAEMIAV